MAAQIERKLSQPAASRDAVAPWYALLFVSLAASAVIAPFLFLGSASGHDFQFHLASWIDVSRQWHEGIFYPRWAESANYGFGEPRFVFYPPLSWMLGALLGTVLPWKMAAGTFCWIAMVLAGMNMFRFAREWFPGWEAIGAAVFFAVNPYHLVLVYYRSDFAELLAIAFLPLAVFFALRISRREAHCVGPFAAAFALIWLANAPAAVITTYSLVLLLVAVSYMEHSPRALLWGGAAMGGGFGLAAFYILPAAWEQRWVRIRELLTLQLRPERNFLFTHAHNPEFVLFNWKVSFVATAVLLLVGILAVLSNRSRRDAPGFWWPLTLWGICAALLMFPMSRPVWRWLPELRFVQFPWRWLIALSLIGAALLGLVASQMKRKWILWIAVFLPLACEATAIVRDTWWDVQDAPFLLAAIHSGKGYEGTDEYQPLGCDRTDLPERAPRAVAGSGADRARVHVDRWAAERKIISVDALHPTTLALKLVNYPAWRAEVNGKSVALESKADTAQVMLPLPPGHSAVDVRFTRTWDRTAGGILSLASAFALIGLLVRQRKRA